jgi:hypothetical protein
MQRKLVCQGFQQFVGFGGNRGLRVINANCFSRACEQPCPVSGDRKRCGILLIQPQYGLTRFDLPDLKRAIGMRADYSRPIG